MSITTIWLRFRIPESLHRPLIKINVSDPVADYLKCTVRVWISSKDNRGSRVQSKKIVLWALKDHIWSKWDETISDEA